MASEFSSTSVDYINIVLINVIDLGLYPAGCGFLAAVLYYYFGGRAYKKAAAFLSGIFFASLDKIAMVFLLNQSIRDLDITTERGSFHAQQVDVDWPEFIVFYTCCFLAFQLCFHLIEVFVRNEKYQS